jgi:cellulose biosynthesis protein BcsQ
MAVIAVWSVKGGVGKTTLAVDMAWRSAVRSGHRTLLWDLDPQAGCSWMLGNDVPPPPRANSLFHRDAHPGELILETPWPGLSLLPADDSLRGLSITLARIGHRRRLAQLTARLTADYPRIILDCPPVLNEISDQVIGAADLLIVPLPPSPLASRALDFIRRELVRNHQRHPPILPVLSMYDSRRKLHREVHLGLAAGWPVIPMASAIEQAAVRRMPIGAFAGWTEASERLQRLWDAIEAKLRTRESNKS